MSLLLLRHPLNSKPYSRYKQHFDGWNPFYSETAAVNCKRVPLLGLLGFIHMWPIVREEAEIPTIAINLQKILNDSPADYILLRPLLFVDESIFVSKLKAQMPREFDGTSLPNNLYGYATYAIDLSSGLNACLKSFNSTTRKQIRQVEREGDICIYQNGQIDMDNFYKKYQTNMIRLKAPVLSKKRMMYLYDTFGSDIYSILVTNNANNTQYYHMFLKYDHVAYSFLASNDIANDNDKISRNLPKYLVYLGISHMIGSNLQLFDFGGISLQNSQLQGINDFKRGFGGTLCKSRCYVVFKNQKLKKNFLTARRVIELALRFRAIIY